MALICRLCVFKCPTGLILRVFNKETFIQKSLKSSTSKIVGKTDSAPIKYTASKVAKMEISETIGFKEKEDEDPYGRISRLIIAASLATFLIYFCILREENDIDDKLRGGPEGKIQLPELLKLKMDLVYCKQMNLPTDAIRARIDELEKDIKYKSPFPK